MRSHVPQQEADPQGSAEERVRVGSGFAYVLSSQVVAMAASLVLGVLVSRATGAEGKGVLAAVQSAVGVLLAVFSLGIISSAVYFVSRRAVAAGSALANAFVLAGAATVIGAAPLWLLLNSRLAVLQSLPPVLYPIALAMFLAGMLAMGAKGVAGGRIGLRPQSLASVASASFALMAGVVLYATGNLTVINVLLAGLAGSVISLVVMLSTLRGSLSRLRPDLRAFRKMLGYSARSYTVELASYLHLRQDVLILAWMSGAAAVGVYSVGVSFAELARYIPLALGNAIFVHAPRVSHEAAADVAARSMRLLVLVSAVTLAVLAVVVPLVVPRLFGAEFAGSVPAFLLLVPGVVVAGLNEVAFAFLYARGLVYWREPVLALVLNLVLGVALISQFGVPGAAIASSSSYTILAVLILRRFHQSTGTPLSRMLVPTAEDVRVLASVAMRYLRRRESTDPAA